MRLTLLAALLLCAAIGLAALGIVWLSGLAQTARRLHDRDRPGWWTGLPLALSALSLVPVENAAETHPIPVLSYTLVTLTLWLWLLVETLGRIGTAGPNRYGPQPPG